MLYNAKRNLICDRIYAYSHYPENTEVTPVFFSQEARLENLVIRMQRQSSRNIFFETSAYSSHCETAAESARLDEPRDCSRFSRTAFSESPGGTRLKQDLWSTSASPRLSKARPCVHLKHNNARTAKASYFQHSKSDSADFFRVRLNRTRSSSSEEFLVLGEATAAPPIVSSEAIDEEFLTLRKNCIA